MGKFGWQVELPVSGLTVSSGVRYLLLIDQTQQLSGFGGYLRMSQPAAAQADEAATDDDTPAAVRVGNPHGRWCFRSAPAVLPQHPPVRVHAIVEAVHQYIYALEDELN
jgi:hypothetical protein